MDARQRGNENIAQSDVHEKSVQFIQNKILIASSTNKIGRDNKTLSIGVHMHYHYVINH